MEQPKNIHMYLCSDCRRPCTRKTPEIKSNKTITATPATPAKQQHYKYCHCNSLVQTRKLYGLQYSHMYCVTCVCTRLQSLRKCLFAMRASLIDGSLYDRGGRIGHLLALSARHAYASCRTGIGPLMHSQTHTYTLARTHVRSRLACTHTKVNFQPPHFQLSISLLVFSPC
jgi:hypothetical protein